MQEFNKKMVGKALIIFSIILFVILTMVKINTDDREAFLCSIISEDPELDMEECPAHQNPSSWFITIAFGINFFILAIGLYLGFVLTEKQAAIEKERAKIDISKLTEEERKIYELLKINNSSMYQSDLIKELGFSKVRISRILDKMENKDVIERRRRGMANLIVLK